MKEFTMSMFATKQHLLEAKCKYLEGLIEEHKKVFDWIERNPWCNPETIYKEIARLNKELGE